mgnify:CR=1 FL=1
MEMEIGPESNEASAVWNEFGLGSLLGDDLDDGDYGPASLSAVDQQQHRRNDALQSVLRRVGPSPEKKRKMQLPYMKAMMGRYGTLPAERKIVNSRVINRLADKYANLDMLSALTPRAQARRREQLRRAKEFAAPRGGVRGSDDEVRRHREIATVHGEPRTAGSWPRPARTLRGGARTGRPDRTAAAAHRVGARLGTG